MKDSSLVRVACTRQAARSLRQQLDAHGEQRRLILDEESSIADRQRAARAELFDLTTIIEDQLLRHEDASVTRLAYDRRLSALRTINVEYDACLKRLTEIYALCRETNAAYSTLQSSCAVASIKP